MIESRLEDRTFVEPEQNKVISENGSIFSVQLSTRHTEFLRFKVLSSAHLWHH